MAMLDIPQRIRRLIVPRSREKIRHRCCPRSQGNRSIRRELANGVIARPTSPETMAEHGDAPGSTPDVIDEYLILDSVQFFENPPVSSRRPERAAMFRRKSRQTFRPNGTGQPGWLSQRVCGSTCSERC